MNSYNRIFTLLTEGLSLKAKRALAANRLIAKRTNPKDKEHMSKKTLELKSQVPTSKRRDSERIQSKLAKAAMQAMRSNPQLDYILSSPKVSENASEGYPEKGIKGGTKAAEKESRNVRRARLKNREAGSMLTRKNQRRLTKIKARLGLGGK